MVEKRLLKKEYIFDKLYYSSFIDEENEEFTESKLKD